MNIIQGMFTGLLGNLSLLSYFIKKRETEVVVVQTLGVVTIYVVISQLAMAGSMPLPHYAVTYVVIACGLVVNFMNYFHLLNPVIWRYWEDFITIAGLSALPQSTFIPYVPNTILPGAVAFVLAILAVFMVSFDTVACIYVSDWETSREGHQICRIIIWMEIDISCDNLPISALKPRSKILRGDDKFHIEAVISPVRLQFERTSTSRNELVL
uniref:Uncharacterized protein n=1 Tax=Solanum lycopersicum TaxID=4081 RepID=A0A3Q7FFL2_SOLLC